ncbi:MAG: SRPBCC family protein [Actinomycetota bacterium]
MALRFRIKAEGVSPEQAFDYVSDVSRHPEWANPNAKMRMDPVSGGTPHLGAKYRSQAVFVRKPVSADLEITKLERPARFAYSVAHHQQGKKDVHYENTFTFTRADGGTLIEKTLGSDGNPIVFFLAYPAIRGDAMKSLRNLKAKLESAPR